MYSQKPYKCHEVSSVMFVEPVFTPVVDLCLDTLAKEKQALVFVNTKSSAEKQAEDVAKKLNPSLKELAGEILKTLPSPTKQCKRLAFCVERGTAFHHSGLHYKQRQLIEDNFRAGNIKIICSTPTLAAGLDMPAYRAILKDLKRYTHRGMQYIPVLEYLQMAGRAGRPSYDTEGQAIAISTDEKQREEIVDTYLYGVPEEIYSKLAAEPVLRTYVLSLLATGYVATHQELLDFFSKTFFGHQYGDVDQLDFIITKVLGLLESWEFISSSSGASDFVSADEVGDGYQVTKLGRRVAELYLDPYTAHELIQRLQSDKEKTTFGYISAMVNTLEMRPLLSVRTREVEDVQHSIEVHREELLFDEPYEYDELQTFMNSIKTTNFMMDWMNEVGEDLLLEKYNIRPGEIRSKLDKSDWLVMSMQELAKILLLRDANALQKVRTRLKMGVKEELLPLVKLKGIGRVRARKMFNNNIKHVRDIRHVSLGQLEGILGKKTAENLLEEINKG